MHLPHETIVLTLDEAQRIVAMLRKVSLHMLDGGAIEFRHDFGEMVNRAQFLANFLVDSNVR